MQQRLLKGNEGEIMRENCSFSISLEYLCYLDTVIIICVKIASSLRVHAIHAFIHFFQHRFHSKYYVIYRTYTLNGTVCLKSTIGSLMVL